MREIGDRCSFARRRATAPPMGLPLGLKADKGRGVPLWEPPSTSLVFLLIPLLLPVLLLFPATLYGSQTMIIGGSGGPLETIKVLAESYRTRRPDMEFNILPSLGSKGGVRAVLDGAIDLAVISRPLERDERNAGAQERILGATPFIFVASCDCGTDGLTLRDIADIYAGRKTEWQDGTAIRLVLRQEADSDTQAIRSMSPEMPDALEAALSREGMILAFTDKESADAVEIVPGSLGTCTLGQFLAEKRKLKILKVEGVSPSLDSVANGTYPYFKKVYMATKGPPTERVRGFMDFISSDDGKRILRDTGYVEMAR